MKIADIIRAGIAADKTNEMILQEVKASHPEANTNAACVNWYRNKAKKAGDKVVKKAAAKEAPKPAPLVAAIGHAWTVSGLKSFNGMEGSGYNAKLHRNGVHVADVIDDASGGPMMIHWKDATTETFDTVDYKGQPFVRKCTKEEKILLAHVATLPKYEAFGSTMSHNDETFIDDLVNGGFLLKQFKSLTKGKVAFLTLDGKIYTMKGAFDDKAKAHIQAKHKGAVILNTLSDEQGLQRLKAMQAH